MKKLLMLLVLTLTWVSPLMAEEPQGGQYQKLGDWTVHYIAFPSTFIQPQIASNYGLERSNYKGIVNIAVMKDDVAQKVSLSGSARNLLGNSQELEFKEIVEGTAVYYLAQFKYRNEEIYRFEVTIRQGNQAQTLSFKQQFYVD